MLNILQQFRENIERVQAIGGLYDVLSWLDEEIRKKHGYLAFQHPDRIADAIRFFPLAGYGYLLLQN